MDDGRDTQIAARMVDRLQPLERDAADIAENSGPLKNAVNGTHADALDERFERVTIVNDDGRRGVLVLHGVEQ